MNEDKNIRVPVPGEEGEHIGEKIRTVIISEDRGVKCLYSSKHKKIIAYIFAKSKWWTLGDAREWVIQHLKSVKSITEVNLDQEEEFLKLVVNKTDGSTEEYKPNSPSFLLTEEIEGSTMGIENTEKAKEEVVIEKKEDVIESRESVEVIKIDKSKQLVYGVFLVPEKADWDGDVISPEDIEKVAHGFVSDYRTIDEMHKNVITADIVESAIAWVDDLDYHGKKLTKGTWFGAIKIMDAKVWDKVLAGEYKAFSVRISGVREPINEEGANE